MCASLCGRCFASLELRCTAVPLVAQNVRFHSHVTLRGGLNRAHVHKMRAHYKHVWNAGASPRSVFVNRDIASVTDTVTFEFNSFDYNKVGLDFGIYLVCFSVSPCDSLILGRVSMKCPLYPNSSFCYSTLIVTKCYGTYVSMYIYCSIHVYSCTVANSLVGVYM